jgi:uncharacterized protein (DUF58 family)
MREDLLDPQILSRIDNYMLLARTIVEGFVSGLHRSLYHGFGSEFVQYRDYTRGDDLKYVDWKVYARLDKLQVKVFQEETNTNCYLVLDCSASMGYRGQDRTLSKLHYAKILAACLAYLVNRQGDNVGFYAYSDRLHASIRPGHRSGQMEQICSVMSRLEAHGVSDHGQFLAYLAERFRRRGIVVFISDFLDTDPAFLKAIRHFRFVHHDCVLCHVLDDDELNFPFRDTVRFIDAESGTDLVTAPEVVRARYRQAFGDYLKELEDFCTGGGIDYERLSTSQPLAGALAAYLHRREMLQ